MTTYGPSNFVTYINDNKDWMNKFQIYQNELDTFLKNKKYQVTVFRP